MTDPRRPDYAVVDDEDVAGHGGEPARVQPPREVDDVQGHAVTARPEVRDDSDDDVEGHVYVRTEDQSRET